MAQGVIILLVFVSIEENLATYVLHQTNTDVDNCSIIVPGLGKIKHGESRGGGFGNSMLHIISIGVQLFKG